MKEVRLSRTGEPALEFVGAVVFSGTSGTATSNRWHEVTVYETVTGESVVEVSWVTTWKEELGHDAAFVCNRPGEVVRDLRQYDPVAYLVGFPPGDTFAQKQERLKADIRARWQTLVTEVLNTLGIRETVGEYVERVSGSLNEEETKWNR